MSEPNAQGLPAPDLSNTEAAPLAAAPVSAEAQPPAAPSSWPIDEDLSIDPAMPTELRSLRMQQQDAIKALAEGLPIGRAAARAGVGRTTLYRWMKSDPAFIAALKAWRARAHRDVRDRMLVIADQASTNLQESVRLGNLAASMAVLRGLGFLSGRPASRRPKSAAAPASRSGGAATPLSKNLIMELRQLLLSVEVPAVKSKADGPTPLSAAPASEPKLIEHQT